MKTLPILFIIAALSGCGSNPRFDSPTVRCNIFTNIIQDYKADKGWVNRSTLFGGFYTC